MPEGAASLCEGLEERSPVRNGRDLPVATVEERGYAPCGRRKSRCLRGERRCKRFHYAEPLSARLWEHRERRCKSSHDVEPLPARLWEHRQHRCKRFHDAEPLTARLWKHRQHRCKRFHDVEPLTACVWKHRQHRCKRFHDAEPLTARRSQDAEARSLRRETRCKRFDRVKPLPAPRSEHFRPLEEHAERLSSRQASRDEQGDDLAPIGDALVRHGAIPE